MGPVSKSGFSCMDTEVVDLCPNKKNRNVSFGEIPKKPVISKQVFLILKIHIPQKQGNSEEEKFQGAWTLLRNDSVSVGPTRWFHLPSVVFMTHSPVNQRTLMTFWECCCSWKAEWKGHGKKSVTAPSKLFLEAPELLGHRCTSTAGTGPVEFL